MKKFTEKAAFAAGAVSLAAVAPGAEAGHVTVTGSPVVADLSNATVFSPAGGITISEAIAPWDIDGDGSIDFEVVASAFIIINTNYRYFVYFGIDLTDFAIQRFANVRRPFQGAGSVVTRSSGNRLATLEGSNRVGSTLYPYQNFRGNGLAAETNSTRRIYTNSTVTDYFGNNFVALVDEAFRFGFKFQIDGNDHYGWADATLDLDDSTLIFTIEEWTYNDEPNQEVHVPVPASIVPAITLLGLGAAGVRRMRRRQAQAAE